MTERGAVLQFEIDRKRWLAMQSNGFVGKYVGETPMDRLYCMAQSAANDTIVNGGTFVLVITKDKITMVQRPDAEPL